MNETEKTIHVLSIEDHLADARLIQIYLDEAQSLGWNLPFFDVERVPTLEKGLARLAEGGVDVVLTDLDLPDSSADETFSTLHLRYPGVPIVVLTGREDQRLAQETVRAGAEDYLFKRELNGSLLAHALIYALERQQAKVALRKAHNELEKRVEERTAELRESEARWRSLVQNSPDFIVTIDAGGRILTVNRTSPREERSAILGSQALDFVSPEERERYREFLSRTFQERTPGVLEAEIADGRIFLIRCVPLPQGEEAMVIATDVTEWRRTETALAEAHERFALFMDRLPGSVFINDQGGRVLYANTYQREHFCDDDCTGQRLEAFFPEDLAAELVANSRRALKEGSFTVLESIPCKDGVTRTYRTTKFPLSRSGEPDLIGGVGLDVSTLREVERALESSQEQLRQIIDRAPALITLLDEEARYLRVNQAVADLFDTTPEALVGHAVEELFSPETAALFRERIRRVFEGGSVLEVRDKLTIAGEVRHYASVLFPLLDEAGAPYAVASMAKDITSRRQVEAALRRSRERLTKAEETAHLGSWEVDLVTNACEWSDEFFRICGFEPGAFVPTLEQGMAVIHPEDRERATAALTRAIEGGGVYDIEKRIVRPDGSVRYVHSLGQVLYDKEGTPVRLIGSFLDITERKLAEIQAERYAAELQRSNQELQQFAHTISHDLRAPLRTVEGFLELLVRRHGTYFEPEAQEFVDLVVDEVQRMQQMIQGLLDFSRVETQGRALSPVDSGAVLERVLNSLRKDVAEHEVNITFDSLPVVLADEVQLSLVFQNLLDNAIKFRDGATPPRVQIAAERRDGFWLFSVRDNGIGIPSDPDQGERIFEVFQRLHPSDAYPGMGIGLALCKRIVERHGGRIWVESAPGEGATFYFTLKEFVVSDGA
ncbi:MAG: PAS domain-containing protein [Anaerolineales bacterium]